MTDNKQDVYWDACAFLSLLENSDTDRVPVLQALMDRASIEKDFRIITSIISITEVAYITSERDDETSALDFDAIDALWDDREAIYVVEFHEGIARDARSLMRAVKKQSLEDGGKTLKPADAIHLATARYANVSEVNTYDQFLQTLDHIVGVEVCEPSGCIQSRLMLESNPQDVE